MMRKIKKNEKINNVFFFTVLTWRQWLFSCRKGENKNTSHLLRPELGPALSNSIYYIESLCTYIPCAGTLHPPTCENATRMFYPCNTRARLELFFRFYFPEVKSCIRFLFYFRILSLLYSFLKNVLSIATVVIHIIRHAGGFPLRMIHFTSCSTLYCRNIIMHIFWIQHHHKRKKLICMKYFLKTSLIYNV